MKKTQGLWGTGAHTEISLKKIQLEMSVEKKYIYICDSFGRKCQNLSLSAKQQL